MPPYLDADNFILPGTTLVNTGAIRNEQYRLQSILNEAREGQRRQPSLQEWYQDHLENVIRPRHERLLALGTANSSAHVFFEGRSYTLPFVRWTVTEDGIDFEHQFGGLGATRAFYEALQQSLANASEQHYAIMAENEAAIKKSKKLFSRTPKPKFKIARPDRSVIYSIFNRKLAESRIPLSVNENYDQDRKFDEVFRQPSSEGGDLLLEMQAWSDSHWSGVPRIEDRDWSKEVIESLPRVYVPIED